MEEVINIKKVKIAMLQVRGKKVMIDKDLAELYGIGLSSLRKQVLKNRKRFPYDFILRLIDDEIDYLRTQASVGPSRMPEKVFPFVFTERGVSMLACILNTQRAVLVNIQIVRAFVG
jgi:hypothetical protein